MQGECIICFAKDYDEAPTSNHHVMWQLARDNRVLWLNSVATRRPSLGSARDLRKIASKLRQFFAGPRPVSDGLWVFTPLVLPLPHSRLATALNRLLLRATLWLLRKKLNIGEFQLWTFLPNVVDYVGGLGESLVVYYCVDEWSLFSRIDTERMAAADRELCRKADVVFATADALVEQRRALNPATYLAPHGVDHELFARALDHAAPVPADVADLPAPRLGFYGSVEDWVDQPLIAYLAARHPAWQFILIGPELVDTSRLRSHPNVHLLGARPHELLPDYCRAFSVGLIPYVVGERMRFVNPIKLREYLSAGLPVVSTAVPEVARYASYGSVLADDYEAFDAAIARALAEDSAEERQRRSDAMRSESWSRRIDDVATHVTRAMEDKQRCPSKLATA